MSGRGPCDDKTGVPLAHRSWRTLSSRHVYETPWLRVRADEVELPTGGRTTYSVVECGECVGILPLLDDGRVVMVEQYRYIAGRVTLEMPTGGVRPGETPAQAAQRELAEEAGWTAGVLEHVSTYHTSKSSIDETAHLFIGRDLAACPRPHPGDEPEFTRPVLLAFDEVVRRVLSGDITDSMTIIAVLLAARGRAD